MENQEEALPPAPNETANDDERSLIEQFLIAKDEVALISENLKSANQHFENIEERLLKLLQDDDKRSSAKYEGLGHVTIIEGAAHASIEKGRQAEVLDYLKEKGREDMIKSVVHAATLSTFVRECLKMNEDLPPGVTFYKPRWLNFYPVK